MIDLIERLESAATFLKSTDCLSEAATAKEAAKEITRLRKIVDALTVKLNKEVSATYQIEERLTNAENRMAKLFTLIQEIRMKGLN